MQVLLAREGFGLGTDRTYRLWRQAGLQALRKPLRRRIATGRPRPTPPAGINHVWASDFVFDACANGLVLKCLTVVDEWTQECHAIDVGGRIRSARVIEVLSRLISLHGPPRHLRSDNAPEFVSRAVLRWLLASGIETAPIDLGKPWENGTYLHAPPYHASALCRYVSVLCSRVSPTGDSLTEGQVWRQE